MRNIEKELEVRSELVAEAGCRIWMGYCGVQGYGVIGYKGKNHRVHRLAWMLVHGPIQPGLYVCHRCDVTSCLNVDI